MDGGLLESCACVVVVDDGDGRVLAQAQAAAAASSKQQQQQQQGPARKAVQEGSFREEPPEIFGEIELTLPVVPRSQGERK